MTGPGFVKVRFVSKTHGATAGLVVAQEFAMQSTTSALSRLYPHSEALKMERLEISRMYSSREEAFFHDFNVGAQS